MTRLYEMQEQLVQIDNILADNTNPETEEILNTAKEELLNAIDGKIENILDYIADCKAKSEQLRDEVARLSYKRGVLDKKVEYLKNLIISQLKLSGEKKAEYGTWTTSLAKTPDRVVLDACDDKYPDKFKKWRFDIDKTALKQEMTDGKLVINENGEDILLAHLESNETLRIK